MTAFITGLKKDDDIVQLLTDQREMVYRFVVRVVILSQPVFCRDVSRPQVTTARGCLAHRGCSGLVGL